MVEQLNKDEFEKKLEELGRSISRLANKAEELHDNEWLDLHKSWQEALDSSPQLRTALITKALGVFNTAMDKYNMEIAASNTLLHQVFENLPEISEEED